MTQRKMAESKVATNCTPTSQKMSVDDFCHRTYSNHVHNNVYNYAISSIIVTEKKRKEKKKQTNSIAVFTE